MTELRKGSIISEYQYGVELVCEIISDVTTVDTQQEFQAKVVSVNGITKKDGSTDESSGIVEYLIGGAYGASIQVLQY